MKSETLLNPYRINKWDLDRLYQLGCWLEGIKLGSGGKLEPLGAATLDSFWRALGTLREIEPKESVNPIGVCDKQEEART